MPIQPNRIPAMPSPTNRLNGVLTHHPTLSSSNYSHKFNNNNLLMSTIKVFTTRMALQVAAIQTYPTSASTLTLTTEGSVLTLPRKVAPVTRTTRSYPGPILTHV